MVIVIHARIDCNPGQWYGVFFCLLRTAGRGGRARFTVTIYTFPIILTSGQMTRGCLLFLESDIWSKIRTITYYVLDE